jgi:citrate synthase
MFTVMFAIARTVGWVAQWKEMLEDPNQKIGRPRQMYCGISKGVLLSLGAKKYLVVTYILI